MQTLEAIACQLAAVCEAQLSDPHVRSRLLPLSLQTLKLLEGLAVFSVEYSPSDDFTQALLSALKRSFVLEHSSRLLLRLLVALQPESAADKETGRDFGNAWLETCLSLCNLLDKHLTPSGEYRALAMPLLEVLSGPCTTHAALSTAVAVLCAADGGATYGLPPEVLRCAPFVSYGLVEDPADEVPASGLIADPLRAAIGVIRAGTHIQRTRHRFPVHVLLRLCRMGLRSLQAAPAGDGEGGGGGGGPSASAQRARGRRQAARPAAGGGPGIARYVPPSHAGVVAVSAVSQISIFISSGDVTVEEAGEWWRSLQKIVGSQQLLCWAYRSVRNDLGRLHAVELLYAGVERLPPRPPPRAAAALAAGLLPHLERLLRRAGEAPTGPEGDIVSGLCQQLSPSNRPNSANNWGDWPAWRFLAAPLAYGEPRQAAALVATIGKVLHRMAAAADMGAVGVLSFRAYTRLEVHCMALGFLEEALQVKWYPPPGTEVAPALQTGPMPSAGATQMGLMLSYALVEWLPPLSRAVQLYASDSTLAALQPDVGLNTAPVLGGLCYLMSFPACSRLTAVRAGDVVPGAPPGSSTNGYCGATTGGGTGRQADSSRSGGGGNSGGSSSGGGRDDRGHGWQEQLLADAGVWDLLNCALDAYARDCDDCFAGAEVGCSAATRGSSSSSSQRIRLPSLGEHVLNAFVSVAAAFPTGLRAATEVAASASRDTEETHSLGGSESIIVAAGSARCVWGIQHWPMYLRTLLSWLDAEPQEAFASGVKMLAAQLESWWIGAGSAGSGVADAEPFTSVVRTAAAPLAAAFAGLASVLPPPDAARRLVRMCAYPGCVLLEGDSELGVPLQSCGKCGAVWYCSRECQAAHWRAGHRGECSGRRG